MNLSGYTMVRNARELDYPIDLTIRSLLHGCDDVTVGVAASTDGTWEWLNDLFGGEKRVYLIGQEWRNPVGKVRWWTDWINETRAFVKGPQTLMLDADEVVDPAVFPALRTAPGATYTLKRLNYWRDARHVVKTGHCCSDKVVRFAPVNLWMTSDEIYRSQDFPEEEPPIRRLAQERLDLRIHHLGFLRKREALFKKVEVCLRAWFGAGQDSRLLEAMKHPEVHWSTFVDQPLEEYGGPWPELIVPWLRERGAL